ncbi:MULTISPECIES: replication-associated recombination protein A [unclassified Halomonas]|uniref:replication-associated recombination protein A n=1 Tax=unclassified Halomonas TaxID=2609666 RepID=UPI001EF4654D|nr:MULTISPECIES: replication-associated recombination protein A [unclassified Halomonas]MCG7576528.1 replication-associated recombination protein A [Halomonas sp. MMH1-48]MCG7603591.1 replication-associated recombination protein A [Halomonas sp. MM17-34]MCG7612937.1 replication-associated recombination protein A [Halomonas sp. MM17-29]MCG7619442.1 replication-associated recombination protein A [Halomonas sp. DSH1-27]
MDLFDATPGDDAPLAYLMRPLTLDDYIGQQALVGPDKPLRRMAESGVVRSMILWGPPGVGKTTLAELLARASNAQLEHLSAVMAGVKEIRTVVERARQRTAPTLLFLDEIHRLNKSQQDALLPHVESGLLTLIGATTENPSFEVNSALLSRARVYVLKSLTQQELVEVMEQALADTERGLGKRAIEVETGVLDALAHASAGDARRALGLLETACDFTEQQSGREVLRQAVLADVVGHHTSAFDKQGDAYYDLLSAIHKSIRSSRPDAALLYMARFIQGGGDPLDIVRRLTAIASEDVGNADPRALPLVIAAWDAYLRLGDYEGQRAIAHAAIHLAVAPKSNRIDRAWKSAQQFVQQQPQVEVPTYLRNAPTKLMEQLGHGEGYRYAHNEPNGYPAGSAHDCWPEDVPKTRFYEPSPFGQEKRFGEIMAWREERDQEADRAP